MSTSASANPWFYLPRRLEQPRLRLFCFPCAGGGASSFGDWAAHLPAGVELAAARLPGRESRGREQLITEWGVLIESLLGALRPMLDGPFAFFGHSTGALIAFELARRLRQPGPAGLIAACACAPHLPLRQAPIHTLPREAFIAGVRRYGGIPDAVLAHPQFLEMILPILRADLGLLERYPHAPDLVLACPIVGCGAEDRHVRPDEVEAWASQTSGKFTMHRFAGDHFFFRGRVPEMLHVLNPTLESWRGA